MRKALMIAGPTASGKTRLSVLLANKLSNVEIVNSDSVQMYVECNVGSNKISLEEQNGVKHHLIDVFNLENHGSDYTNVGWFSRAVKQLTSEISSRGMTPLVVGGNGFYHEVLFRGIVGDHVSRDVTDVDPKALVNDPSHWGLEPVFSKFQYDVRAFALSVDRYYLYNFIGLRCERIIEAGLLEETYDLLRRGLLTKDSIPYNAIGYRQSIQFLERCMAQDRLDIRWLKKEFLQYVANYKAATRNYAKRQYNWLRRSTRDESELEDKEKDFSTLPPPQFLWLNMDDLFISLLDNKNNADQIDLMYNQYADRLVNYSQMSRDEYESVIQSDENHLIASRSKGMSAVLFDGHSSQGGTKNRSEINRQFDSMMNQLYIYKDVNHLEHRCQLIRKLLK